jgi:hypothetical protein
MNFKLWFLAALVVAFVSCESTPAPDCPPAEECPDCPECPAPDPIPDPEPEPEPEPDPGCDFERLREECEFGVLRLKCECKPDPDVAKPEDYIPFDKVESHLFWQTHRWEGLYAYSNNLTWAGNRDVLNSLRKCPWAYPDVFVMTANEAREFAVASEELGQRVDGFIRKMWVQDDPGNERTREEGQPKPNKRCDPSHAQHHPDFCEVTDVKKDVFSVFKVELVAHNDRANGLRGFAHQCRYDEMSAFDSISGWCDSINKIEKAECPE